MDLHDIPEENIKTIKDICLILKSNAKMYSNCIKRKVGAAILVDGDYLMNYKDGYNVCPGNIEPCDVCMRKDEKPGENSYLCRIIHAEINAIMNALKSGSSIKQFGGIVVTLFPCAYCAGVIIETGIKVVFYGDDYYCQEKQKLIIDRFKEAGVLVIKLL